MGRNASYEVQSLGTVHRRGNHHTDAIIAVSTPLLPLSVDLQAMRQHALLQRLFPALRTAGTVRQDNARLTPAVAAAAVRSAMRMSILARPGAERGAAALSDQERLDLYARTYSGFCDVCGKHIFCGRGWCVHAGTWGRKGSRKNSG